MESGNDRIEKHVGVVSAIKESPTKGAERYTIISDKVLNIGSETALHLYDEVEIVYENNDNSIKVLSLQLRKERSEALYYSLLSKTLDKVRIKNNIEEIKASGVSKNEDLDKVSRKMLPKIDNAATELVRALVSGSPIIVRFHSDGDGSTGAIALYNAIEKLEDELFEGNADIKWISNRGISYPVESFYMDSIHFNNYKSVEKPIVCIVDFGTTNESNDAIDKIEDHFKTIWLDHHPIMQDFKGAELENYINPIMFGGSSDISAGFLTCLFAEAIAKVDVERLKEAALISDFSAYANNRNHEASKYATILDFVTGVKDSTHYLDGPLTPKYLSKLLEDKEKRDSIYSYANDLIEEAIKFGIEKSKEYKRKDGITINVIDFEHIAKKYSGYLLPGRYSSKLQGSLEAKSSNGNITIVTFRNYISIRLGKKIAEKVRLLDIIEELKATSGLVDSGGGHHEAASIRVYQENMASVINLLLNAFGAKA